MNLSKDALIAEWKELNKKLKDAKKWEMERAYIEGLLTLRFGFDPSNPENTGNDIPVRSRVPQSLAAVPDNIESEIEIDYDKESRLWYEQLQSRFATTTDLIQWIEAKYGHVNRNSVGGPLRRLQSEGLIAVELLGQGRRPTKYKILKNFQP